MAIGDDFSVAANGDIRHTSGTATYTTIEFHRWLASLSDDASSTGDDLVDILTDIVPSTRRTDQIIELNGTYNIDDTAAQFLYGGSISQASGGTLYSGLRVIGNVANASTQLQVVQNNALLTNYWGTGLNDDATAGVLLRILVKSRDSSADIDGKRIRVQAREMGDTFAFFNVTLGDGESVASIETESDNFDTTAPATIATWTDIVNNLEGYQTIDLNNGNGAQPYYSEWDRASRTLNQLYERAKWLTRRGTSETIYGMNGELFLGITHSWPYDTELSGPFTQNEVLSWGSGSTAGTGALLAINDQGTTGTMYIQLLTGVAPTDNDTVTGGTSSATADVNGTPTARTVPKVFIGSYAGSISGAYGAGIEATDVGAGDALRDLTDTPQNAPTNVVIGASGLVVGEDYLLIVRNNGSDGIDTDEYSLAAGNNSGNGTLVISESIKSDTPSTGWVRAWNGSRFDRYAYTSFTGSTFTLSGTLSQNYTATDDAFVPAMDKLATSTQETATYVYNGDVDWIFRRRDGGGTPTVPSDTTNTVGTGGLIINANRVSDA